MRVYPTIFAEGVSTSEGCFAAGVDANLHDLVSRFTEDDGVVKFQLVNFCLCRVDVLFHFFYQYLISIYNKSAQGFSISWMFKVLV